MTDKLVLLDGNSLVFRAFFALHHQLEQFTNQEGLHTNAIFTFKKMLDTILAAEKPTHILVAFDAGKTTFRTQLFHDYKGSRSKTPSELSEQFPLIRDLLTNLGIASYELPDYEADDIIGTLARQAKMPVVIYTGDRDLTQLVSQQVTVKVTVKGVNELEVFTPTYLHTKLGITPQQIIEMKALVGDTSDNYPGVTKVGPKTALKLLASYGTLTNLYDHLDDLKPSKMKENLVQDRDQAFLSHRLATIDTKAPITVTVADTQRKAVDLVALRSLYQHLDFKQFLSALPVDNVETEAKPSSLSYHDPNRVDLTEFLADSDPKVFILETLTTNYHEAEIMGWVIASPDRGYASTDLNRLAQHDIKAWLADTKLPKYVFDAKKTWILAQRCQLDLRGITFDLLLASYLLDTQENSDDFGVLAQAYGQTVATDDSVYGKGAKRARPTDEKQLFAHMMEKAQALFALAPKLRQQLVDHDQDALYDDIEAPLALVLARMEHQGITVDAQRLKKMEITFSQRLKNSEEAIYNSVGETFNLNSPKQLSHILFETLGLKPLKKTKTGYSTSVDVLEKLASQHPMISQLLEYRQLSKLQSTYVVGLQKMIFPDHKIHTRYLQTLTQTGRLSSVDPNLQNIPIRMEEGRQIRQAFIPSHPNWEIFSSDYSQVELRVLAHISGDQAMQQAFIDNQDIHATTAMKIFNLSSPDEVTPLMRRHAKAVNFGIVYGISDYGLSKNLGISRQQAAQFIAAYFEQYPEVHQYMQTVVENARQQGYVETLMHRRRYLPDLNAKNFNVRSFAERMAMNTPIQGSAADIIKVAMINMQEALQHEGLQAKMLLQVHDELIFEAPQSEIKRLSELVPEVMEHAVSLDVPLRVSSAHGLTWYDAKS